ncbi:MAG: radical SAM family heme chaperone HemW [Nevskiales bacterium]
MVSQAIPLSLYVHIPWCVRKCPYCDFNSHPVEGGMNEAAYVDALLADLTYETPLAQGRPLQSIFFGGGTPSLFAAPSIARIIQAADQQLGLADRCEITLEANPGTAEAERFKAYRAAGVNRLSIGVQSFDNAALKKLGRIHDAGEATAAADMARAAGFDNFNIDLMFALPGQDLAAARADLEQAIALEPSHISYYQLTLEPGTHFHRHPPKLPDHETAWAMQTQGEALLSQAGFEQYEVSAYARAGKTCRHNLNYWLFGDYIGIGAGAHGKLSSAKGIQRRARQRLPKHFLIQAGDDKVLAETQEVSGTDCVFEFLLNALRLPSGFSVDDFSRHTGLSATQLQNALEPLLQRQLIEMQADRVRSTPMGWRHLDSLLTELLPGASA